MTNSDEVKQRLMDSLRKAIGNSLTLSDDKKRSADELLSEIRGDNIQEAELVSDSNDIPLSVDPPHPTPQNTMIEEAEILHNIPHKQSAISDKLPPILDEIEEEGEGVSEILKNEMGIDIENTPLDDFGSLDN